MYSSGCHANFAEMKTGSCSRHVQISSLCFIFSTSFYLFMQHPGQYPTPGIQHNPFILQIHTILYPSQSSFCPCASRGSGHLSSGGEHRKSGSGRKYLLYSLFFSSESADSGSFAACCCTVLVPVCGPTGCCSLVG